MDRWFLYNPVSYLDANNNIKVLQVTPSFQVFHCSSPGSLDELKVTPSEARSYISIEINATINLNLNSDETPETHVTKQSGDESSITIGCRIVRDPKPTSMWYNNVKAVKERSRKIMSLELEKKVYYIAR
ncbi:myosin light chain kinase activity protein [Homalodisca vitripennis]|nr:myosin light chain kinase activity protein [Homalodisca vitripennis]